LFTYGENGSILQAGERRISDQNMAEELYGSDSTLDNDTSRFGDGAIMLVKHQCGMNLIPVQRVIL
jgi:hypothetical protein